MISESDKSDRRKTHTKKIYENTNNTYKSENEKRK